MGAQDTHDGFSPTGDTYLWVPLVPSTPTLRSSGRYRHPVDLCPRSGTPPSPHWLSSLRGGTEEALGVLVPKSWSFSGHSLFATARAHVALRDLQAGRLLEERVERSRLRLPATGANSGSATLSHPCRRGVAGCESAKRPRWLRVRGSSGCWAWLCACWAPVTSHVPSMSFLSVDWEYASPATCSARCRGDPDPEHQSGLRPSLCWTCTVL